MNIFRKTVANPVQGFFRKQVVPLGQNIFRKGGYMDAASRGLGRAAYTKGMVGRELRRGANNQVLQGLGEFTLGSDRTNAVRQQALRGSAALKGASNLMQQGSDALNRTNYRGNAQQVAANTLERAKRLKGDTQSYFA